MYTHPKQIVSAVYGGTELLMFDVDKVITSIDFEVGDHQFKWIKAFIIRIERELHVDEQKDGATRPSCL